MAVLQESPGTDDTYGSGFASPDSCELRFLGRNRAQGHGSSSTGGGDEGVSWAASIPFQRRKCNPFTMFQGVPHHLCSSSLRCPIVWFQHVDCFVFMQVHPALAQTALLHFPRHPTHQGSLHSSLFFLAMESLLQRLLKNVCGIYESHFVALLCMDPTP